MLLCTVGKALCKRLYAVLLLLLSEGDVVMIQAEASSSV